MEMYQKNPCLCCQRVADPAGCDNKDCKLWQRWFIAYWNELRRKHLPRGKETQL